MNGQQISLDSCSQRSLFILYAYKYPHNCNWAMDIHHCCSITGIVFLLAGGAVATKTYVQRTVSLSTAEAEVLVVAWLFSSIPNFKN